MAVTLAASKFAEWLERQMQRRGFGENRSKLAKYVGIRPSAVSAWFTRGAVPSPATCAKLAEVLKLPLDDVLRAAGHESIAGAPEGEQDDYPDWATLIPALTPGDAEYVGRLVESLARNPVHPPEGPGPEEQ